MKNYLILSVNIVVVFFFFWNKFLKIYFIIVRIEHLYEEELEEEKSKTRAEAMDDLRERKNNFIPPAK